MKLVWTDEDGPATEHRLSCDVCGTSWWGIIPLECDQIECPTCGVLQDVLRPKERDSEERE